MVGSHIVDQLVQDDQVEGVVIFDRFLSDDNRSNVAQASRSAKVRIIEGDILNREQILDAVEGCTHVLHLAAIQTLEGLGNPRQLLSVNVEGFFNVLEAARQSSVRKLVFSSSTAAYGRPNKSPIQEEEPLRPNTLYGATKVSGEALCKAYEQTHGLKYLALRYAVLYGPRLHRRSKTSLFIPDTIERLQQDSPPIIYGNGEDRCEWVYVGDVARANIMAMRSALSGEAINVGAGVSHTTNEVAQTISQLMGTKVQPRYEDFEKQVAYNENLMSTKKAERLLGFKASTTLEEGLKAQIAWHISRR